MTPDHLGGHFDVTHIDTGALRFAVRLTNAKTFVDIGCGPGGMVEEAAKAGLTAVGIDGDPKFAGRDGIVIHDFTAGPIEGMSAYDLGWSCEFLEHVDEAFQGNYMAAFKRCRYVVATAAPPGAPGHHHVNCQPTAYWARVFRDHGLLLSVSLTERLRAASTMKRDFMRQTGMFFLNEGFRK
jgi:SAM-dependent methyltransferase